MKIKTIIEQLYWFILKKQDEVKWARKLGASVGNNCRLNGVSFSTEPYLVKIGNHVSATKVHFETHDGGLWVFRDKHPEWDRIKGITVGDNVYFGFDCFVLPGVTIGKNVIVGAKSIITKDIPDNVVVAGSPARIIKSTEEYYNKIKSEVVHTKNMSKKEKKLFLTNMFLNKTKSIPY